MKILMVNDYREPIGGAEVYMLQLSKQLQKQGHEVFVFSSDVTQKEYTSSGYNRSFWKYLKRIADIGYYKKFRKVLREFHPDVIHIHGIYNEITPAILWNLHHKAVLMTVHGIESITPVSVQRDRTGKPCAVDICEGCTNCIGIKGMIYEYIKRTVHTRLRRSITCYIAPSRYLRAILEQKGYRPVVLLYNGISLLPYTPLSARQNLLYVGRLTKEKGILVLLEAMTLLQQAFPDIHLTIVGDGKDKALVEEARESFSDQSVVELVGSIPNRDMQQYYTNATLVILPSVYPDNLPTVGLEALSVGRPVIGSAIGGIPDIVQPSVTGLLAKPDSAQALAEAVTHALTDRTLLVAMSKHARTYAEEYFDMHAHKQDILSLYTHLMHQYTNFESNENVSSRPIKYEEKSIKY